MITRSVLPRICPKLSFREEGTGAGGGSTGEEACEMEVMFIGDFTAKEGASGDAMIVPRALWPFGCDTAGWWPGGVEGGGWGGGGGAAARICQRWKGRPPISVCAGPPVRARISSGQ